MNKTAEKLQAVTDTLVSLNALIALGGPLALGAVVLGRQLVAAVRGYQGNKTATYEEAVAAADEFDVASIAVSDTAATWLDTHPAE